MPISRRMDKEAVVHIHHGILLNLFLNLLVCIFLNKKSVQEIHEHRKAQYKTVITYSLNNQKIITNSVLVHVLPCLRKQISGWGGILHPVSHLLLCPVGTDYSFEDQ